MELLIAAIIIGVVIALRYALNSTRSKPKDRNKNLSNYHYHRKDYFMSIAERKMFDMILAALGDEYYVFPQVHLSTLLDHKIKGQNWERCFQSYKRQICGLRGL